MYNGGYGGSSTFRIQDYAPVDPLNGLQGMVPPQAPTQNTAQQPAIVPNRNSQPGPSATGTPMNRIQSSGRDENPARDGGGIRRHMSTEEMRREIARSVPYIPTPINNTSTGAGSSATQPKQSTQRPKQQHNAEPRDTRPSDARKNASANSSPTNQQQQRIEKRNLPNMQSSFMPMIHQPPLPNQHGTGNPANNAQLNPGNSTSNITLNALAQMPRMLVPPPQVQMNVQQQVQGQNMQRPPGQMPFSDASRIYRVQQNPDIYVYLENHPSCNTHVIVNNNIVPLVDFVESIPVSGFAITEQAAFQLRIRLPPGHRLRLIGGQLPLWPLGAANPSGQRRQQPQVPNIPGQGAGTAVISRGPPANLSQQNVPGAAVLQRNPQQQGFPHTAGAQQLPVPFGQQNHHPMQMIPNGMSQEQQIQFLQMQHLQQQNMLRQQQQHLQQNQLRQQQDAQQRHQQSQQRNQLRQQQEQQQHQQQAHQQHQLRQQQEQQQRQQQLHRQNQQLQNLPPRQQPHNQQLQQHPPESRQQPAPPNVPGSQLQSQNLPLPVPPTPVLADQSGLNGSIEPPIVSILNIGISADEPPPPCAYTPSPTSSSPQAEEAAELKPVVHHQRKPTKKKKVPEVITIDDDEPRRVLIKTEPLDAVVSSTSESVSNVPSSSASTRPPPNIKQERNEEATCSRNYQRPDQQEQQQQPRSAANIVSVKTEPVQPVEPVEQQQEELSNRELTLELRRLKAMLDAKIEKERKQAEINRLAEEQVEELRIKNCALLEELQRAKDAQNRHQINPEEVETPGPVEIKINVQESQVSTSEQCIQPPAISPLSEASRSRTSSVGSDILAMRPRKKIIEESEDDDEMENTTHKKPGNSAKRSFAFSTRPKNQREKRPVTYEESDDEMPTSNKKKRLNKESSDDDDDEWDDGATISTDDDDNFNARTDRSDDDDLSNFIVDDGDEIEEEEDSEYSDQDDRTRRSDRYSKSSKNDRKSQTPRSKSPTPVKKRRDSPVRLPTRKGKSKSVDEHRNSSEAGPSTPSKPMTSEEKKAASRRKSMKTKEENREKVRLAQLERMNQYQARVGRRTRCSELSVIDPLNESLSFTINQFNRAVKETPKSNEQSSREEQRKDNRREKPAQLNKRATPSVSDDRDDDGVHIPAKRTAHANSVPGGSRDRPTTSKPPISKNRPNQAEIEAKRQKESADKKKKDREEYNSLKAKKSLTDLEKFRMNKLEKLLNINQVSRPAATSKASGSTSSSFKRVTIKQEVGSPVKRLPPPPPPPDCLDPTKGRSFVKFRKWAINAIHSALLEGHKPNPAEEAQRIELEIATLHPTNEQKYRTNAAHKIEKLRKECNSGIIEVNKNAVSHQQILTGVAKENCTVEKGRKVHIDHRKMTSEQLGPLLEPLKMTEDDLEKNGYPLFNKHPKRATIAENQYTQNKKLFLEDYDLTRTCSRCNKDFRLNPDGTIIREKDICRYHNRGKSSNGKKETFQKRYTCCNEETKFSPPGCKFSDVHVFDQLFKKELTTFVSTPRPSSHNDPRTNKAYALDCEMVYTIAGPALARLTMVDMQNVKVLDVFVKPPKEVIDPNTEFSGLTMADVQKATDTLQTCHQKLFKFVNSETVLIGQSLESDFKAMRIVHKNVIDTSVIFSSKSNTKLSLRLLTLTYLKRMIQGDNEDAVGHDSYEDAVACVDLIYFALKNPENVSKLKAIEM
ncbi:CRE-PQE-1 protein [Caenorhabditis remanei]|uniref:CRE-PQE-1 protein n=1 Tax=Caenorhabditis remanei TaxID=31234 RepID=E3LZ70_CAERE|nr:CRE-PQE-1 protein [Caenorhabditis remanei]